ncbi:sensor domain-containing diguanylate cyclase [candidate division TA06 bacterium]|uniref:Sensor domain-containing diguanylate cyclase n=1 Tax=candidate division TA06 bacterium TaxID=2250710 RepID=A0A933IAV0_UNCT6|nr:sensor domain-containing diguanylate cyclase [candidate division TA06 bacterium]
MSMTIIAFALAALFLVLFLVSSGGAGKKTAGLKEAQERLARLQIEDRRQSDLVQNLKTNMATLEKEKNERTRVFMVLLELARTLSGNIEQEKLPPLLLRIAQQLFDAEELIFFKPEDDGHALAAAAQIGVDEKTARSLNLKVGNGYLGHTAAKRLVMTKEDFATESNLIKQHIEATKESGIAPVLCLPLVQHNVLLGLVSIGKITQRAKEERNMLMIYQSLGSMAMENARMFDQLYTKDRMTDLFNWRYFEERAQAELSRSKRFGHKLSFTLLDLDNFKTFAEANGTQAAEKVLAKVGALLNECVRKIDIPCRMSEDSFAVALLETERVQAVQFAEKIKKIIEEALSTIDQAFASQSLTVTLAVMTFPDDGFTMAEMFDSAAKKLAEAQAKGGSVIIKNISEETA